jgi:5-methylcytosine-specific restriction endonuclease McrA
VSPSSAGSGHPVYDAVRWWLAYGHGLLPVLAVLCFVLALLVATYLWFLNGARIIAAAWVWRRARTWWRHRPRGDGGHSAEYEAVLSSPGWRRLRRRAIRRAGRRCQRCGARGPLDVHHLTYRRLGRERPGDLLAVCERCHGVLHGRAGGGGS